MAASILVIDADPAGAEIITARRESAGSTVEHAMCPPETADAQLLNQEIGYIAQRASQGHIEPRADGEGAHCGGQAGQQATKGLGPMALQGAEILEWGDDLCDDLPVPHCPTTGGLGLGGPRRRDRRRRHDGPLGLVPVLFPANGGVTLASQRGAVPVGGDQGVAARALVAGGRGHAESRDAPAGVTARATVTP